MWKADNQAQGLELTYSVEGIHKLVKDYISKHCMVDMTAQGGATATHYKKNLDELWTRSPAKAGADKFLLRVAAVLS